MEIKSFLKNTSYLVFTKFIKFFVGIARAKLIAVFLGTAGAGIISQIATLTKSMSNFTLLSMNDGLVKQIAESEKNNEFGLHLASLIKSYIVVILIILIPSIVLLLVFSRQITILFLGDIKYHNYYLFGIVSFPILILNSVSYALLKGFKKIKYIARSELIVMLINFIFFLIFVYYFGVLGGVIHIGISYLTILIVNNYFARKKVLSQYNLKTRDIYNAEIKISSIKELFVFAGFGLTSGVISIFAELISRSIVVTNLGVEKLGVYTPITAWAGLFTGLVLTAINTYLYPRFSELKDNFRINGLINDVLRFNTFLFLPVLFLAIPLRSQIIPIFYSSDFMEAAVYLPWHFIGVLFYLWMYTLAVVLTPTGRIKHYGMFVISISLINLLVVYIFVPIIGLYGWMLRFTLSPVVFFILYKIYLEKQIQFRFSKDNRKIMIYAILGSFGLIFLEKYFHINWVYLTLFGLILSIFSVFFMTNAERNFIVKKIKLK